MEYVVMAEEHPPEETTGAESGVFGNLPSARPGVRSPRRGTGRRESSAAAAAPAERPAPKRKPQPEREPLTPGPRPAPPPRTDPPPRELAGAQGGGVEDLAWAGITVAAEAATLGVRLLSRAVEAVRKPSDER
jgi:hypothetical protein